MKFEIPRALRPIRATNFAALTLIAFFLTRSAIALADPATELASFSVFDKIDVNDLAKSDVKTLHGPPMSGRFLSVQSCYVAPGSPAQPVMVDLAKMLAAKDPELREAYGFDDDKGQAAAAA